MRYSRSAKRAAKTSSWVRRVPGAGMRLRERLDRAADPAHRGRGVDAVAGDVADRERDAPARERERVVPVPADREVGRARLVAGGHVEARVRDDASGRSARCRRIATACSRRSDSSARRRCRRSASYSFARSIAGATWFAYASSSSHSCSLSRRGVLKSAAAAPRTARRAGTGRCRWRRSAPCLREARRRCRGIASQRLGRPGLDAPARHDRGAGRALPGQPRPELLVAGAVGEVGDDLVPLHDRDGRRDGAERLFHRLL